jgi:hypothetical protein
MSSGSQKARAPSRNKLFARITFLPSSQLLRNEESKETTLFEACEVRDWSKRLPQGVRCVSARCTSQGNWWIKLVRANAMISRKEVLLQAQPYAIAFRVVGKHATNCVQVISSQLFIFVAARRTTTRSLTIWFPPERIVEGDWVISSVRIEIDAAGISSRIFTKEPTHILIVVSGAIVR